MGGFIHQRVGTVDDAIKSGRGQTRTGIGALSWHGSATPKVPPTLSMPHLSQLEDKIDTLSTSREVAVDQWDKARDKRVLWKR